MLLSKSCEYGLRALLYLAAESPDAYVSLRDLSRRIDVPYAYLGKIFQQLNDSGLTASQRGPSGGVALARDPATVTLYEIVAVLDGEALFTECVLGLPGCGQAEPCPLHDSWGRQRDRIELLFRRASLAETAREVRNQNYRLAI
jgi:Rrf2 family protein